MAALHATHHTTPSFAPNLEASYAGALLVLLAFGAWAVYMSTRLHKATANTEAFITARNTQGFWRVFWSFYATSIGAWVVFVPAAYTAFAGWISIITTAAASGIVLLVGAELGVIIVKRYPDALSLNDFVRMRYGKAVQTFVVVLELVNMGVVLLAEYTAIGDLFEHYVGSNRLIITVYIAVVTSVYTAMGGLHVSIVTDQAQSILTIVLMVVASMYLAVTFRYDLPTPLPPNLAANYAGYSSIFSLPICVLSNGLYSESIWQRVWAAKNTQVLRRAGWWSCLFTTLVIAFFGFVGFLGLWARLPPLDSNHTLTFFIPFSTRHDSFGVILVILAATMNESAVDSFQNAIVATFASNFLMGKPVWWSRVLVFVINVPIVLLSLQGFSLLDIFLGMNIITVACMMPLFWGLWDARLSGTTVLWSSLLALLSTCGFCITYIGRGVMPGLEWMLSSKANNYDYKIFLVPFLSSMAFVLLGLATLDRNNRPSTVMHSGKALAVVVVQDMEEGPGHGKEEGARARGGVELVPAAVSSSLCDEETKQGVVREGRGARL